MHRFPASYGQERLWFIENLFPGAAIYDHTAAWRLRGSLDEEALSEAFRDLQLRHEPLRTSLDFSEGRLWQVVKAEPVADLELRECSEAEVDGLVDEFSSRPFDLSIGPLLTGLLLRVAPKNYLLLLRFHHTVVDGWSIDVIAGDLAMCYRSRTAGGSVTPVSDVQFADFSAWQRNLMDGEHGAKLLQAWTDRLEGVPARTELEPIHPRPQRPSFRAGSTEITLGPQFTNQLRDLAAKNDSTLFHVLLSGFMILLHRYTDQERVAVGTPIAGRPSGEVAQTVGFFADTAVIDFDFSQDPSIEQVLVRIRETSLWALTNQVPFGLLIRALSPQRDLGDNPIFQSIFAFQSSTLPGIDLEGTTASTVRVTERSAAFSLTLELEEVDPGLQGNLLYSTDFYEDWFISQVAETYLSILKQMVQRPGARVSSMDITGDERSKWIVENSRTGPARTEPSVVDLFRAKAAETPRAPALITEDGAASYEWLESAAGGVAASLVEAGLQPEGVVGVALPRGPELVAAALGVMWAGGVYLPLDLDHPKGRLEYILRDSDAAFLITKDVEFSGGSAKLLNIDDVVAKGEVPRSVLVTSPRQAAYLIYTSGSTGAPKGVLLEHGGLTNLALAQSEAFGLDESSRVLQFAPVGFDASVSEIFTAIVAGASVFMGTKLELFPGQPLVRALIDQQITVVTLPPAVAMLLDPERLPDLRTLVVAGEDCPSELARRWSGRVRLINAYGPTEATVCATMTHRLMGDRVTIGTPMQGTAVYILDRRKRLCPPGVPGEIHIAGAGVGRGYVASPSLTAGSFIPDAFGSSGARMYASGDRGRLLANGDIDFLGRGDSQVKLRGIRLELQEIESHLTNHPSVSAAAAALKGGGDLLVAYVVGSSGDPDIDELRTYLARSLPGPTVPSVIVAIDAIPLTTSGKIDRASLPEPQMQQGVPPLGPTETAVAAIWCKVLDRLEVGATEKFFEAGGDSLKVVQLYEQLEASYPDVFSLGDLFELTTVRAISERIERLQRRPAEDEIVGIEL